MSMQQVSVLSEQVVSAAQRRRLRELCAKLQSVHADSPVTNNEPSPVDYRGMLTKLYGLP